MTDCVVGMVTCSSRAEARKIAKAVLTKKLAACVNIVDGAESHYWWRGTLERARECLLLIKTTRARAGGVTQAVKSAHSYQLPEIIFVPVVSGERRYLKWLRTAVMLFVLSVSVASAGQFEDLVKQLGSADEEQRVDAAEQLAQMGGTRVQNQFREMLQSQNPERRQMAVIGLLQVSDEDADLERVHARLKDENSTVRWSAVLALSQTGRPEVIPWLEEAAASDSSDSVKEAASEAVEKLRSGILWLPAIPQALKQARDLKKPVLAYFFLRGSEFCAKLEEGVLADPLVVDAAGKYVCVRVDAVARAGEARKFDVRGAPTILLLDGDGNEMSRVTGLVEKTALISKLAESSRSKLTFREARRRAMHDPGDVQANWKVADGFLEDGREDLAEPHLRNVIAHDEQNRYGYTPGAMFALGFCLGKRGEYGQAVYSFEHLLARWPNFKDKDKALYCLGLSQLALGHPDKGRAALEQLVREFPDRSIVKSAKVALEKLEAKGKGSGKNQ